jgi:hypothetical protein
MVRWFAPQVWPLASVRVISEPTCELEIETDAKP